MAVKSSNNSSDYITGYDSCFLSYNNGSTTYYLPNSNYSSYHLISCYDLYSLSSFNTVYGCGNTYCNIFCCAGIIFGNDNTSKLKNITIGYSNTNSYCNGTLIGFNAQNTNASCTIQINTNNLTLLEGRVSIYTTNSSGLIRSNFGANSAIRVCNCYSCIVYSTTNIHFTLSCIQSGNGLIKKNIYSFFPNTANCIIARYIISFVTCKCVTCYYNYCSSNIVRLYCNGVASCCFICCNDCCIVAYFNSGSFVLKCTDTSTCNYQITLIV